MKNWCNWHIRTLFGHQTYITISLRTENLISTHWLGTVKRAFRFSRKGSSSDAVAKINDLPAKAVSQTSTYFIWKDKNWKSKEGRRLTLKKIWSSAHSDASWIFSIFQPNFKLKWNWKLKPFKNWPSLTL